MELRKQVMDMIDGLLPYQLVRERNAKSPQVLLRCAAQFPEEGTIWHLHRHRQKLFQ
jgi:hypothetical protein